MIDIWERFSAWMSGVEEWTLSLTESLWIYPGVWAVALIDGVFPVVPSDAVVIGAATTGTAEGTPIVWLVWIAAAIGAWCGDQIAYTVGRRFDVRRHRFFARARVRRALDWAEGTLERRGTTFIIAARFIPFGRVAVNLTAGALRYPRPWFMVVDGVGAFIWASYSTAIGVWAGSLFDNLLVSIAVGVAGGVLSGILIDKVLQAFGFSEPELPDLSSEIAERLATGELEPPRQRRPRRDGEE